MELVTSDVRERLPGIPRYAPPAVAPAIVGVWKRSQHDEQSAARAISVARQMTWGVPRAVPVVHGGRIVAVVRARDWRSPEVGVWKAPHMRCGFASYGDMISEMTAGKRLSGLSWSKTATTNPVANNWHDLWAVGGDPASGDYAGTANTSRQFDDTTTGSMPHGGNKSTDTKHIIAGWALSTATTPHFMLVDRVLSYDSNAFTANANQNMTTSLTAQRYASNGDPGLLPCCVVDTTTGATAANLTACSYTDQAGGTGHTMPTSPTMTFIASATQSSSTLGARVICPRASTTTPVTYAMPLTSPDTGVRKIEAYTTSAANSGTWAIVLVHPIAFIPIATATVVSQIGFVADVPGLERIIDGACLNWWGYWPAASGATVSGAIDAAWG